MVDFLWSKIVKNQTKVDLMLKKIWDSNYFINTFMIPMFMLTLYFFSYAMIVPQVLSSGVNCVFAQRMWKYVLLVTIITSLVYFALLVVRKIKLNKFTYRYSLAKFHLSDLLFLLLPLTPVIQYIITNQYMLAFSEALVTFGFLLVFSCVFIYIIPIFLGNPASTRTLMAMGIAFSFTLITMPLLSQLFAWYEWGQLTVQLPVFAGVFLVVWLLDNLNFRSVLYLILGLFFISNTITQVIAHRNSGEEASTADSGSTISALVAGKKPLRTPDIYLLIYDSYPSDSVLSEYGIDNSDQADYLGSNGFKVYDDIFTVKISTIESMSRVFEVSNTLTGNKWEGVSGDGAVQNILKSLGYKTYGVFPSGIMFRNINSSYDYTYPARRKPLYIQIISGVLIGEFRFDLHFEENTHEEYVSEKLSDLANAARYSPIFLYSHSNLPIHSQNSGTCLADETAQFEERLKQANEEMKQDIETVIANDPDAIIIIAGDHGPYLTKNCTNLGDDYDLSEITRLDIQDRYSTFLAIRWPDGNYENYDDVTVLQDIFPDIFAYMYDDASILGAKVAPDIESSPNISGAAVENGIIVGGVDDGEPLFPDKGDK